VSQSIKLQLEDTLAYTTAGKLLQIFAGLKIKSKERLKKKKTQTLTLNSLLEEAVVP